jgi:hypothetical protein
MRQSLEKALGSGLGRHPQGAIPAGRQKDKRRKATSPNIHYRQGFATQPAETETLFRQNPQADPVLSPCPAGWSRGLPRIFCGKSKKKLANKDRLA